MEMACSSIQSSSSAPVTRNIYDVFVSFRGEDTRNNFTDILFGALKRKGILAFRDNTNVTKGESIAPELLRAIEGSQVFVVVFSKNYASSKWCLWELEKILECVQVSGKRVLPIFYDVDPSEVRNQRECYAEAFAKHEFEQDLEMVQRWRAALTQAANLSGWDLCDKPQYAEIEKIVKEIIDTLGYEFSSLPNDLVRIHSPIEELEKLLLLESTERVRVVGICGMGGLGKTTLATVLYGRIFCRFVACCFIDDVSKIYRHDGPLGVQKQILNQIESKEDLQICNLYNATNLMRRRLRRVRALIILDNVDQAEQLEKLAMNREWLGIGSRVIIISRDEHILKEYGVDGVYKVPLLGKADSLQLLCRKAFKCDNIMSDYEELAYDILYYANGLPLAIKVLGSFLFGRDITEWRSALARLRESPSKEIMDVLRLSFDGLDEMEKEIFLHIACFLNREGTKYVKNILNCCGFHPDIGLKVLVEKSLITIDFDIEMHNLLEELGKKIVEEDSTKNPKKWSRLWRHENFSNVMSENMEKNVEAVVLRDERLEQMRIVENFEDLGERAILMGETLSKMSRLRLLILHNVSVSGSLSCLSYELRFVDWYKYPFKCLPSSFQATKLIELHLQCSRIEQLWEDKKCLLNLRTLDLSYSKNLIKMPDFGEVPNLERLNLKGCVELELLDPSISVLTKLVFLNLDGCKNLRSIPNSILGLCSLEYLNLSHCSKEFNSPNLSGCWLPSLPGFFFLRELNVSFCGLRHLPDAIGCVHWLERLNLGGNKFVTLPSLKKLSKLLYLNLQHCNLLKSLPVFPSPSTIEKDHFNHCNLLRAGLYIFNCPNLGEWEHCSNMAFSWMIQFIRANQESSDRFDYIDIVIPGSEIPRWFSNQSVGHSIKMDPSPIMHDNNVIGLALCVVLSAAPVSSNIRNSAQLEISIEFADNDIAYDYIAYGLADIRVIINQELITAKSNHIWLIYFPREPLSASIRTMTDVTPTGLKYLRTETWTRERGGLEVINCELINCGYHWVFQEDLQRMHRENPLGRRREFVAIEDQA